MPMIQHDRRKAQQAPPPGPKRKPGRPEYQPTDDARRMVEAMVAYGVQHPVIAGILRISTDTLQKHFREELDLGKGKAITAVANNLYRMAVGRGREAATCAIFFLKTQGRWREKDREGLTAGFNLSLEAQERVTRDELTLLLKAADVLERLDREGLLEPSAPAPRSTRRLESA